MQTLPKYKPLLGELMTQTGLLTPDQLREGLSVQKIRSPATHLGQILVQLDCISDAQLEAVLIQQRDRLPIGELLIQLGAISALQLQEALLQQQQDGAKKRLGELLRATGLIDKRTLLQALNQQSKTNTQVAPRPRHKFDSLVDMESIQRQDLDAAITMARNAQCPVENILLQKYQVSKQQIGQALSTFYKCPFVQYDVTKRIKPELLNGLNSNYLKAHGWVPLEMSDTHIQVLLEDPQDAPKLNDIRQLFPGKKLQCVVGFRDDVIKYIESATSELPYGGSERSVQQLLREMDADEAIGPNVELDTSLNENHGIIVRLVNQIIVDAHEHDASDIHIEPDGPHAETGIRFRVDGHCYDYLKVPANYRWGLVSRLKIMANLDISERRKPQDGKIKFRLPQQNSIELRVATIPTAGFEYEEDVVLRLLPTNKPLPLQQLKLSKRNETAWRSLLTKPYGLLLCVGPTGSGKTTTLHSTLSALNERHRKIWTAEDPVEITQKGLRQVQVHPKIGFTFAAALRAFLRADPDVMMIGEIRDQETAEICLEASLTGHLVLSTLHTNSTSETVSRLLDMGMDPFTFADALLGVLAQRLARTICVDCKTSYRPPKDEYDALANSYGEAAFARLRIPYDDKFVLHRGKGCERCQQSGYRGRIALHELLVTTEEIKSLIHARATVTEISQVAGAQSMTTLLQDGVIKVLQGHTDYTQVKSVAIR